MISSEASQETAKRLRCAANKLIILSDNTNELKFSTDKTVVLINPRGLKNGNISVETGAPRTSGKYYVHSVIDLSNLPRNAEDINRMKIAASILESFLTSIQ